MKNVTPSSSSAGPDAAGSPPTSTERSISRGSRPIVAQRGRAERIAVLDVVALLEAAAEAEDRATARHMIDGPCHVGHKIWVAVPDAADQRTERNTRRRVRPRGQHRPAFKARRVGVSGGEEVVPVEQRIGTERFGLARGAEERGPVCAVLRDLKPDSDRPRLA
jgi:hypothetical protein